MAEQKIELTGWKAIVAIVVLLGVVGLRLVTLSDKKSNAALMKEIELRLTTDYFPDEKQKPLSSEISAWELARRFAIIEHPHSKETGQGDIANVFVVDDLFNPVPFYGTNELKVFNAREDE